MTWYSSFRSRFFAEWSRRGLPEAPASPEGREAWPRLPCPLLPRTTEGGALVGPKPPRALDPRIVETVYGFGVFVGEAFGHLYGVGGARSRARAAFCGQFNLGISLFDFVCDEGSTEEFDALGRLPSLRLFNRTAAPPAAPAAPTLAFLDLVAGSVLAKLRDDVGPAGSRPSGLWKAMFAMFEAQVRRARMRTDRLDDPGAMRAALRLSAAEPFRVMSEWMARAPSPSPRHVRRSSHFGRCVGDCFWLIDDAKDVWDDLAAGRWNRFLLEARAVQPDLRLQGAGPFEEARLVHIWESHRTVEHSVRQAVGRLAASLRGLRVDRRRSREALQRIHASMLGW